MDKASLLDRLAEARRRAEQAELDIVTQRRDIEHLERRGLDSSRAKIRLRSFVNGQQIDIKEVDWLLDELDKLER